MHDYFLVAVPSNAPGGLNVSPHLHFGHCDSYTIALVNDRTIIDVVIEPNESHELGKCLSHVRKIASMGVKVLIVGKISILPYHAMRGMGIDVYYANGFATVKDVLQAFINGQLHAYDEKHLCPRHSLS